MAKRTPKPTSQPAKVSTEVRNTAVPRPQTPPRKTVTQEMIAKRAYEISLSGSGGSELDNWLRAERELKG